MISDYPSLDIHNSSSDTVSYSIGAEIAGGSGGSGSSSSLKYYE